MLIGENGSGKSTLMKCLSGIYPMDEGTIEYLGKPLTIENVNTTINCGIKHGAPGASSERSSDRCRQYLYGTRADKWYFCQQKGHGGAGAAGAFELGATFQANTLVGDLSIAEKQLVEIAKAVNTNAKILILDEPTAVLTEREVTHLFGLIRKFTASGMSIIYISHRMEEIFEIETASRCYATANTAARIRRAS